MKTLIRTSHLVACLLLITASLSLAAQSWDKTNADQTQFILRGPAQRVDSIAARYGLTVLYGLSSGDTEDVALVQGSPSITPEQMLEMVADDDEVLGFEPAAVAALPIAGLEQSTASLLEQSTASLLEQSTASLLESTGTFADGQMEHYFAGPLWKGYADQPAVKLLGIHGAS